MLIVESTLFRSVTTTDKSNVRDCKHRIPGISRNFLISILHRFDLIERSQVERRIAY